MTHTIYLVRHGEQQDAEHGMPDGPLSPRGRRQAELLAARIGGLPIDTAFHSPLERAAETMAILQQRMPALRPEPSALLFDCIPSGPDEATPAAYEGYYGSITQAEIDAGSAQMADAMAEFLAPQRGDRHDLLVTHNVVIAWFVREVLDAPAWRWMTVNQANCGLTVIQQKPGRPWTLLGHNDLAHLPFELRTGLAEPFPI